MQEVTKPQSTKSYTFLTNALGFESIETKAGEKHYVTGHISTKDLDLDNDVVTKECMMDMVNQLKSGNIKLDVEHEAFKDSPNIIPVGKIVEAKLDDGGVFVKAELNEASPKFLNVWGSIKNGFIDAFSIAYKPIQAIKKSIVGKTVRLLQKVKLLNVALTGNPVNPSCLINNVFTKSLSDWNDDDPHLDLDAETSIDELKGKSKNIDTDSKQSKSLIGGIKMSETKADEMTDEEKKKKKEEEDKKKETKSEDQTKETKNTDISAETKSLIKKEMEEMKSKNEELEKTLKSINEKLDKTVMKSKIDDTKNIEQKSQVQGALDFIR